MRAGWMPTSARSSTAGWARKTPQGLKQYFFPLAAGYWRAYNSPEESFWCCTGTGVEEFAKFADTIYFRRGSDLYVNQFIASTLDWKDEGLPSSRSRNSRASRALRSRSNPSRPARAPSMCAFRAGRPKTRR